MSKTDPSLQEPPAIDVPPIVPGSYARLNDADKAIVDSILVSTAFEAAARAKVSPQTADEGDRALLALTDAVSEGKRTIADNTQSFVGEMLLELNREYYAASPELIAAVRDVHLKERTPASEMHQYTRIVNDMIAVDGNQFEVQRDLPEVILPGAPGQNR